MSTESVSAVPGWDAAVDDAYEQGFIDGHDVAFAEVRVLRDQRDKALALVASIHRELNEWPSDATSLAYNEAMSDARRVVSNLVLAALSGKDTE